MLQTVKLGRIYTRIGKTERLSKSIFSIKTGILDRHQANVCRTGDSHDLSQCIHRTSHSPCTGSTGQKHNPYPSDDRSFLRKTCLRDRNICTILVSIFMPGNVHMILSDHLLHHSHFPVCRFTSFRICSRHPSPIPFAISIFFSIFLSK